MSRFDHRGRRDLGDPTGPFPRSVDVETRVDHVIARWQHRARVTSATATAVAAITLLLVLGAVVVRSGNLGESTEVAKRVPTTMNTSARTPAGDGTTVPPSDASTTSRSDGGASPRSDRSERSDRDDPAAGSSAADPDRSPATNGASTSTTPPDDATPPAITAISITPPDTTGVCTASWSADDGGTPIKDYLVSTEPVVTPPDPGTSDPGSSGSGSGTTGSGTAEPGPAPTVPEATPDVVDQKTKDAFTDAPLGTSLTVTARNAVGTSEPTEPVVCGD